MRTSGFNVRYGLTLVPVTTIHEILFDHLNESFGYIMLVMYLYLDSVI